MINILIADDHTIVRKGLIELVENTGEIKVAGEAKNYAKVMHLIAKQSFDVVVLDVNMPGRSGLEALKDIKKMYPKIPVLILSMYPEEQYAVRVIKAGASGYLNKDSAPEELINAIKIIAGGKKYISITIAEQLADHFDQSFEKPLHEQLSDREYEVMLKISDGVSLTTIANELSLSVKTISTYKSRIQKKLNLKTSNEITHYVISNNLNSTSM